MYSHAAFSSSYAALYYPWLEISDPGQLAQRSWCRPLRARWQAASPAATRRPTSGTRPPVSTVAASSTRSPWPTRPAVASAMCSIRKDQRHRRVPDTASTSGARNAAEPASAVDRINVRRLMMFMGSHPESSRFVVFEPNHPQTWRALGRLINPSCRTRATSGRPLRLRLPVRRGDQYPAVIDRNEMVARVFVKPTKTAEFIELNFILDQHRRGLQRNHLTGEHG